MKNNLADIRTDYSSQSLDSKDVNPSPTEQFTLWMNQAMEAHVLEPTAMNLATVDTNGKPSSRIVLLKGLEENTFVFFTNYSSHKGVDLAQLPFGALNFFWPELERQVRIEGNIKKVSAADSDVYFASRPYASKIGAWVSEQSKEISNREALEKRIETYQTKYPEGSDVPRPEYWGGYALTPTYMEFWQGRPSRLHDRIVYEWNVDGGWKIYRICP